MTSLYAATMSLDGFIAGPGGDMSWLTAVLRDEALPPSDTDAEAEALERQVGCLLVGGRTHRGEDPNAGTEAEGGFGGRYDGPAVVLTRTPPPATELPAEPASGPVTEFCTDVGTAVARATELAGDSYVNVLGASCARALLERDLLDEVLLFVAPVMLGDGVRVLDRPGGAPVRLDPKPGRRSLWYTVRR